MRRLARLRPNSRSNSFCLPTPSAGTMPVAQKECLLRVERMHGHRYVRYTLGLAAGAALGLSLALWRLGLPPAYAGLAGVNAVTLLLYGYDKRQAIVGGTRIPELALHLGALLGGSPAALLGQQLFRHKTRKLSFQMVFAAIALLQIVGFYGYWRFVHGG
jgi:uncharacterized membrane protein YsdA (DUF1294 family)